MNLTQGLCDNEPAFKQNVRYEANVERKTKVILTDHEKKDVLKMYANGVSKEDLIEQFGMSRNALNTWIRESEAATVVPSEDPLILAQKKYLIEYINKMATKQQVRQIMLLTLKDAAIDP